MTNIQESKYSMEIGLRDFLNKNASITSKLPAFGILFTQYNSNLNEIQDLSKQQEVDKSGISENKNLLHADLVAKALDVSRKTESYATMNNHTILAKAVHYSETDLNKSSDLKLTDRALIIHDKAFENIAALADYGVTKDMLTDLKNAIVLFDAAIPAPRTGITESKQVTNQITRLLKANDVLLNKFDLLMEVIHLSEPAFYSEYKDQRKVINTGKGSLVLIVTVIDAETGDGIKGAKFTITPHDETLKGTAVKNEQPLVKTTAKKGRFNIKSLSDGTYYATVVKPGYKKQELTLDVSSGDLTRLKVKLERN
jgi:hypothetical protein